LLPVQAAQALAELIYKALHFLLLEVQVAVASVYSEKARRDNLLLQEDLVGLLALLPNL
jgi:hypothetical protein